MLGWKTIGLFVGVGSVGEYMWGFLCEEWGFGCIELGEKVNDVSCGRVLCYCDCVF